MSYYTNSRKSHWVYNIQLSRGHLEREKTMEREKTSALKCHRGNFDSTMSLSVESHAELKCWIDSIESSYNVVHHGQPELTLNTDASTKGWGCFLDPVSTGGLWTAMEAQHHINYLELLAIFLALKVFVKKIMGKHVKVLTDHCTAMADINHMGTSSCPNRNALAKKVGCGVPLTIFGLLLPTFQESAMLRQTDNHVYLSLS